MYDPHSWIRLTTLSSRNAFKLTFKLALSHLVLDIRRVDRYFARWCGAPPLLDIAADNLIDIAADNLIGSEFEVDLLDKRKLSLWWLLAGRRVKLLLVYTYCWCALASPQTVCVWQGLHPDGVHGRCRPAVPPARSHKRATSAARRWATALSDQAEGHS